MPVQNFFMEKKGDPLIFARSVYSGVFGIVDYESVIRFLKFKWRIQGSGFRKENVCPGMFRVTDYEFLITFRIENDGFNIAVTKMKNRDNIGENINLGGFRVFRAG